MRSSLFERLFGETSLKSEQMSLGYKQPLKGALVGGHIVGS